MEDRDKTREQLIEELVKTRQRVSALERAEEDRKRTQQELHQANERLELALKAGKCGLWEYSLRTGEALFSKQRAEMLGYSLDELEPDISGWGRLVHPEDIPGVIQALNDHLEGRSAFYESQHRLRCKSGEWKWILARGRAVEFDAEGKPLRFVGTSLDITERKEAEEGLRKAHENLEIRVQQRTDELREVNEELLREIAERRGAEEALLTSQDQLSNAVTMAHLGPWEYDAIKDQFTFNDHFYKLFRTASEQVGGYTMSSADYARRFVHPDDISVVVDEIRKARETTDPHFSRQLEHRIVYADGEIGYVTVRFSTVKDHLGRTVRTYGVNQDITERKRLEQLQLQSERLRAVADLAGGVAHNFNNLLQIVIGSLELALIDLESGRYSDVQDTLKTVLESSRFGAETVRRLQSFAGVRDQTRSSDKEVFELSEIVRQAVEMSKTWWKTIPEKQGIEISVAMDLQDGCLVRGRRSELFEVVVNLTRNAVEALPQGGGIAIQSRVERDEVVVTIQDTGIGVSEENLKRLFNPFFTTKASAGSGLGLATSRKVIEDCGGRVFAESSEGNGTTFTIHLPLAERPSEPLRSLAQPISGSGKRILVIDDMKPVVETMKAALTRSGHVVVTASSGQEGLEIFRENPVDLVICDLGMPGTNGWEVGKGIRSTCEKGLLSKPPFILLTGWAGQITEIEQMTESGVDAVVEKPIDTEHLLNVVAQLCEKGSVTYLENEKVE